MCRNIVELLRKQVVDKLFDTPGFNGAWSTWRTRINTLAPNLSNRQVFDLGDHLSEIFFTTNTDTTRSQSAVSGGGANWEGLVCWYLNLCLIGRRTVVIKHNKNHIPAPVSDAITVTYGTTRSNTESDLIAITFPDLPEYTGDKDNIDITDNHNIQIPLRRNGRVYNLLNVLNGLCTRDFNDLEIHIIQCKTNWNDNAQIPMLWDAVYSASAFRTGITVGVNGYSIIDVNRFTYSFVTVPSNTRASYTPTSTAVLRVRNISGGNFWGKPSEQGVANSIKEMLAINLRTGHLDSHITSLQRELPNIHTEYSYFNI